MLTHNRSTALLEHVRDHSGEQTLDSQLVSGAGLPMLSWKKRLWNGLSVVLTIMLKLQIN